MSLILGDFKMDQKQYDLEEIKRQTLELEKTDFLSESALINEDFTLFSMFMNGLVGFMMDKDPSKKMNFVIRGNPLEVDALRKALINNKLLLCKISQGQASPRELDTLRQQANKSKTEFEQLTGIRLPF